MNQNLIPVNSHHQVQQQPESNQSLDENGLLMGSLSQVAPQSLSDFLGQHNGIVSQHHLDINPPPSSSPLTATTTYAYYPVSADVTPGSLRSSSFSPSSPPPPMHMVGGGESPRSHSRVKMRSTNGKLVWMDAPLWLVALTCTKPTNLELEFFSTLTNLIVFNNALLEPQLTNQFLQVYKGVAPLIGWITLHSTNTLLLLVCTALTASALNKLSLIGKTFLFQSLINHLLPKGCTKPTKFCTKITLLWLDSFYVHIGTLTWLVNLGY